MNILASNVRGLGGGNKDFEVRNLILKSKIEVVGITKSQLRTINDKKIVALWGSRPYQFISCNSSDTDDGGLVLIWNPNYFSITTQFNSERWIMINGSIISYSWQCTIILMVETQKIIGRLSTMKYLMQ